MRTRKLIMATLVVCCCSLTASAQKDKDKDKAGKTSAEASKDAHHGHGSMNPTDEQKKKMREIHLKTAKEVMTLKNQEAERKARLRTLTTADKPDMNEINKTIDEMTALKSQIMKKKVAAKMEVRSLLNDEQRLHFDMKGDKMMKRMKMKKHVEREMEQHPDHHDHD